MSQMSGRQFNVVGNWRMPVLGDLNERAISLEEVGEAVNEMRSGNSRAGWNSGGMFKERWDGNVGMAGSTVKLKF